MQEKLIELWKRCKTKQLAKIFKDYMQKLGATKWDYRKKVSINTFYAESTCGNWNRTNCMYLKDSTKFYEHDLEIVLRKEAGNYLIISRKNERAFEVDCSGIRRYDKELLEEIIADHKPLFDKLFEIAGVAQ